MERITRHGSGEFSRGAAQEAGYRSGAGPGGSSGGRSAMSLPASSRAKLAAMAEPTTRSLTSVPVAMDSL